MAQREQIGIQRTIPMTLWRDAQEPGNAILLNNLWNSLRGSAANLAGQRRWRLERGASEVKRISYCKLMVDESGPEPKIITIPATQEDAEYAMLQLTVWAVPR